MPGLLVGDQSYPFQKLYPAIAMMQSAQDIVGDDATMTLCQAAMRGVLPQSEVRARRFAIFCDIRSERLGRAADALRPVPSENLICELCGRNENQIMIEPDGGPREIALGVHWELLSFARVAES